MSVAQASVAVSPGQQYTVNVGSSSTVGAVVIANESPYALRVSNGASTQWIVAQTADIVLCNAMGFSGSLIISTDNYLTNAESAPSFLIYLTTFAPGEAIPGQYPAPLMRLTNGSIGVATQLVNDGNSVGSNIIESTPAGAVNSYVLVRNDGTFQVWAVSNNVLTEIINVTPGATSSPASLALKLLQVLGAVKLDSGKITTDGAGNLIVGTVTGSSSVSTGTLAINASNGGQGGIGVPGWTLGFNADDALYQIGGFSGAGAYGSHRFVVVNNGSQNSPFGIGQSFNVTPLSWIDGAGVLHATAPVTLAPGNQETGAAIVGGTDGAGAFRLNGVNFKTVLTNTPSSITLTVTSSSNIASVGAQDISKYGFAVQYQATAAAFSLWNGTYSTVGNCLLAVNAAAQTLDHHCDACGHVSLSAPFSALTLQRPDPTSTLGLSLGYSCPACGAIEAFNLALSAADEADTTPQGTGEYQTTRGAQAALIRQLMAALGLPLS